MTKLIASHIPNINETFTGIFIGILLGTFIIIMTMTSTWWKMKQFIAITNDTVCMCVLTSPPSIRVSNCPMSGVNCTYSQLAKSFASWLYVSYWQRTWYFKKCINCQLSGISRSRSHVYDHFSFLEALYLFILCLLYALIYSVIYSPFIVPCV